jgi:predicted O-methyltransferase YrrM
VPQESFGIMTHQPDSSPSLTGTVLTQLARDLLADTRRKAFSRPDVPWMLSKELDIMLEVLARLAPTRCLEWGAGGSTLFFPPRIPGLRRWLTMEHDGEWAGKVQSRNQLPQVEVKHIQPDAPIGPLLPGGAPPQPYDAYVRWPETLGERFDLVFVDGKARPRCLRSAYGLVEDRGLVVLHDANREQYFTDLPPFRFHERFGDWRHGRGGIWVGSKGRPIGEVLDITLHRRLWRAHERVTRSLFLR